MVIARSCLAELLSAIGKRDCSREWRALGVNGTSAVGRKRTFDYSLCLVGDRRIMRAMSPLARFYIATVAPFPLIPITILAGSYDERLGGYLLWATLGVFLSSTIFAQLFARCPKCHWRIASFGKPFVRSLPPHKCPRCGTDLTRPN